MYKHCHNTISFVLHLSSRCLWMTAQLRSSFLFSHTAIIEIRHTLAKAKRRRDKNKNVIVEYRNLSDQNAIYHLWTNYTGKSSPRYAPRPILTHNLLLLSATASTQISHEISISEYLTLALGSIHAFGAESSPAHKLAEHTVNILL